MYNIMKFFGNDLYVLSLCPQLILLVPLTKTTSQNIHFNIYVANKCLITDHVICDCET